MERGRLRRFARFHPRAIVAAGVLSVGLAIFVLVWFQPQKLFIEETVDEALPGATGPAPAEGPGTGPGGESDGAAPEEGASRPDVVAEGAFASLEHETTGTAKIVLLDDGTRLLRLEDLSTSNGPDLRVYLSEIPRSDDWFAYGERFVDLGALKGNRGDQNYEIPNGVDLSRYKSAVIWCRRFTVGFGVAGLS